MLDDDSDGTGTGTELDLDVVQSSELKGLVAAFCTAAVPARSEVEADKVQALLADASLKVLLPYLGSGPAATAVA